MKEKNVLCIYIYRTKQEEDMYFVGIDIGSSAAKVVVMEEGKVV